MQARPRPARVLDAARFRLVARRPALVPAGPGSAAAPDWRDAPATSVRLGRGDAHGGPSAGGRTVRPGLRPTAHPARVRCCGWRLRPSAARTRAGRRPRPPAARYAALAARHPSDRPARWRRWLPARRRRPIAPAGHPGWRPASLAAGAKHRAVRMPRGCDPAPSARRRAGAGRAVEVAGRPGRRVQAGHRPARLWPAPVRRAPVPGRTRVDRPVHPGGLPRRHRHRVRRRRARHWCVQALRCRRIRVQGGRRPASAGVRRACIRRAGRR